MDISFKDSVSECGMPVVCTDDRRLCFLVDTGASFCVLLREAYERERHCFGKNEGRNYLIGMEGNPRSVFTVKGRFASEARNAPQSSACSTP